MAALGWLLNLGFAGGTAVVSQSVAATPLQSVFVAGARAGALFTERAKQSVFTSHAQAGQTRRGEV